MCILFVYTNTKPQNGYRLIIASNRDEDYSRPAKTAFKCLETNIIGGRDMQLGREGGMWLGISTASNKLKFGALLNAPHDNNLLVPSDSGRGPIVYNYLQNHTTPKQYIENQLKTNNYSAYNCIMIQLIDNAIITYFHSNSPEDSVEYNNENNEEQFLGFGNSSPNTPLRKVVNGTETFKNIIKTSTDRNELKRRLIQELLRSKDKNLPDPILVKNVPKKYEELSSVFVQVEDIYGTRAHTLVLVDNEGNVEFVEHSLKEIGNPEWEIKEFLTHL